MIPRRISSLTRIVRAAMRTPCGSMRSTCSTCPSASFLAPELLLSLWRPVEPDDEPNEEQGYFFGSVLLAASGYYDTPAQAAERARMSGHMP